jgi:transcriptional antiterminator RfaH
MDEPTLFPETLLDDWTAGPSGRQWWALHTKPRQEKALARQILRYEIPFYLPLVKKRTVYRGQKVVSFVPLFASYVFTYASNEERVCALTTKRVVQTLAVGNAEELVFDLRQFRRLIESNAPLTLERRIVPGNRVRVLRGSFMGMEGVVLKRRGETRLLVAINFLQQGASVEIDDFCLEKIDSPE